MSDDTNLPVTQHDLTNVAKSIIRSVATVWKERLAVFEDRLTTLETSSDVKTIQRDERGRAERLVGGRTDAVQLRDQVASLAATVAALERRLAEAESASKDKVYRGVWHAGEAYRPSNTVTHDGSVFYCKTATTARPGKSPDWVLMVKRGQDGKDAPRPRKGIE